MKKSLLFIALILFSNCKTINYTTDSQSIKNKLAQYLFTHKHLNKAEYVKYKKFKKGVYFEGIFNKNVDFNNLKNGIYAFSRSDKHYKYFFFILNKNSIEILDVSTLHNLEYSLGKLLDFAEKEQYSYDLTKEYVNLLTYAYFELNPKQGIGIKPEKRYMFELKDTIRLP